MSLRRVLGFVIGAAVLIYVAYGMLMIQVHGSLVFPFHDQTVPNIPGFVREELASDDGTVTVWVHDGTEGAPLVLYFMGNIGNLGTYAPMVEHHAAQGRSVVAMGYRGGGSVPGEPTETRLKADALTVADALETIVPGHGPVIVHGYSLGTGVAVHVAAERAVDGLILSAPYARMCELMVPRSWLPACQLPGVQKWQSLLDAARVTEPSLVLHGVEDHLIPLRHGERMVAALRAAGADARFAPIPGAGHNDLLDFPDYVQTIDGFVEGIAQASR